MINEHPDIQALYVSWDRPALLAIKALKALNRTDIAVFTTDLDFEIAEEMNQGFVKGLSTQRPYDQGKAAALAVAKSLVSDNVPKYIGVQPYVVHEKQLKRAWKDIFFEALPEELRVKKLTASAAPAPSPETASRAPSPPASGIFQRAKRAPDRGKYHLSRSADSGTHPA